MKKPRGRVFRNRKRSDTYDPNDEHYTAIHEAAHAAAAIMLGIELDSVELKRRPMTDGKTSLGRVVGSVLIEDIAAKGENAVMPCLIMFMAGAVAESYINPLLTPDSVSHEWDVLEGMTFAMLAVFNLTEKDERHEIGSEEEIRKRRLDALWDEEIRNRPRLNTLWKAALRATVEFVETHHGIISRIASVLKKRRTLTRNEVIDIVKPVMPSNRVRRPCRRRRGRG